MITTILSQLKANNHRITKARTALLTIFLAESRPLAAPELTTLLHKRRISSNKTTVYRELQFLQQQSLVREITLHGDKKYYELAGDHHHHLVCTSCSDIQDIQLSKELHHIESRIRTKHKFRVSHHALEFFGLCATCQLSLKKSQ